MNKFEALFGIKESQVKKNCILLPLLPKGILAAFKIKSLSKGKLYSCANHDNFTLIQTGVGAGFTADAVLYLKETVCENVILFGSCGAVEEKDGISIASLVIPNKAYANESFSLMLLEKYNQEVFYPYGRLTEDFLSFVGKSGVKKVVCSTLGSLKLEEDKIVFFVNNGVSVVDMECSAFFCAASQSRINCASLFYVSDIIKEKPYYCELKQDLKIKLSSSIKTGVELLCGFVKEKLSA